MAAFWLFRISVAGSRLRPELGLRLPEGVPLSGGREDALVRGELLSEGRIGVDDGPEAGLVSPCWGLGRGRQTVPVMKV